MVGTHYLGDGAAGVVDEVGDRVTGVSVGDEVLVAVGTLSRSTSIVTWSVRTSLGAKASSTQLSVPDVLEQASLGMDRSDAVERRRGREAGEQLGQTPGPHRVTPYELRLEHQKADAVDAATAVTVTNLGKVQQQPKSQITQLKSKLHALGGKP
jgi:hypothetical protein